MLRRKFLTLVSRNYSHRKLQEMNLPKSAPSSMFLQQKIGSIIRRRKLDRTLQASRKPEILQEATEKLSEFDSTAAYDYFRTHKTEYSSEFPEIVQKFQEFERKQREQKRRAKIWKESVKKDPPTPLELPVSRKETSVPVDPEAKFQQKQPMSERMRQNLDRGFYVYSDSFCDDYMQGETIDLPNDLLSPEQKIQVLKRREELEDMKSKTTHVQRFGSLEPVEDIEFQLPAQQTGEAGKRVVDASESPGSDWKFRYGVADPKVPPSNKTCSGCGARFHCQDTSLPGFLPAEMFLELKPRDFIDVLCRRCYLLKHHNFLLNVSVSPVNYREILGKLKDLHEILIILIVDMVDFPSSILKDLPDLLGDQRALMIVGNKVDLLPPDAQQEYLNHFRNCLGQTISRLGFRKRFNLLYTGLISAKTGFGIEQLITHIYLKWENRGDVYLVGCTNVGKSSLFNSLLQSDLCKVRARDLVERATTSIWPGTTLNLLKFPVMNPSPYQLDLREKRLRWEYKKWQQQREHLWTLHAATHDQRYAILQGYVGQTFKERPEVRTVQLTDGYFIPEQKAKKMDTWNPDEPYFKYGNWCLDTPGTVNDDQIINYLTLEELIDTVPKSCLMPRTYVIHPGQCLMVAGLARIDCKSMSSLNLAYLTVFASRELPIHVIRSENVDNFVEKYAGSAVLKVPFGDEERLKKFPSLIKKELSVMGLSLKESCADITLSSAGWVAVTGPPESEIVFDVWTPHGKGITLRQPALLPFAVNLRGNRVVGTPGYLVRPIGKK